MGNFVHFWGYYGPSFHISIYIKLKITVNMQFRLTFHIKLVLFKNINSWLIYGLEPTKFRAFVHLWAYGFLLITESVFVQYGYKIVNVYKFRRPL